MPSPFPGMDPYLEGRTLWPDVHDNLVVAFQHQLVPQLRPRYLVNVERRVYVLDEDDPAQRLIIPDVAIVARSTSQKEPGAAAPRPRGAMLLMASQQEVAEPRLVIRRAGDRELVAVIELLSPTNKVGGSQGREEDLAKRRDVLRTAAHLVEVDLLRAGTRIPSVDPLPPGDYHAHVSRAWERPRGEVFSWTVRDPLPSLPVPLRQGEAEAVLDLQAALTSVYDLAGYDLSVTYGQPPEPPLASADQQWAAERLARRA